MNTEEVIAIAGAATPLILFALHATIERIIAAHIKPIREEIDRDLRLKELQIEQLQKRMAILQVRLGDDPETFIRSSKYG